MQPAKKSTASFLISLTLLLGAVLIFAFAFLMGFTAILPLVTGRNVQAQGTIEGVSFGFEALVLFAATYLCFQKYLEHPQAERNIQFHLKAWHVAIIAIVTGVSLVAGYFAARSNAINWLILPPLTVPAVTLPIVLLFAIGARRIQLGPRWRVWGILGLGMTLVPLILIVLEIFAMLLIIIAAAIFLASQPGFSTDMMRLAEQMNALQNNEEALIQLLTPYMLKPGIIISVLLFLGVIVPFTEELIKPLGVWFFAGRLESPAQGFALGTLSGAAYALIETFNASGQTDIWASLLFSRIGTALLHITTTGLMGWGIALAWQKRRYLSLLGIYLVSSFLHGLWNVSVISFSLSNLAEQPSLPNPLSSVSPYMLFVTLGLTVTLLAILLITNARLTRTDANDGLKTGGNIEA